MRCAVPLRGQDDRRYYEAPGRYPIEGAYVEGWGLYRLVFYMCIIVSHFF